MFSRGFPEYFRDDVEKVVSLIPPRTYGNVAAGFSDSMISYMQNGFQVQFPYRLYFHETSDKLIKQLNKDQQMILNCIYSRSCNGFIRERHIAKVLESDYPDWAIPYIVKVCDEYVKEILHVVYEKLKGKDTSLFKSFCADNYEAFCKSYHRMLSYWNEFYRSDCPRYEDYVGRKIFMECFGASRTMK